MPCPDGILPISPHHDHRRAARPPPGGAATALHPRARARPGRDGDGLPRARPQARPARRAQGPPPEPRAERSAPSGSCARSGSTAALAAPAHPPAPRLRRGRRPALLRHALRRGRDRSASGSSASGSFRSPTRSGSRARSPTRSTTPTGTASSTATSSRRTSCCTRATRWWPTSGSPRLAATTAARRSPRPAWRSGTPAYMSPEQATGAAGRRPDRRLRARRACCTRCWPASRRSPDRRRKP